MADKIAKNRFKQKECVIWKTGGTDSVLMERSLKLNFLTDIHQSKMLKIDLILLYPNQKTNRFSSLVSTTFIHFEIFDLNLDMILI